MIGIHDSINYSKIEGVVRNMVYHNMMHLTKKAELGQVRETVTEKDFEIAINKREFVVYYQPKMDVYKEEVVGAEALVRWKKQDGTMISPAVFIPALEREGLIAILDAYVYCQVCRFQQERMRKGEKLIPISVNLSRVTLQNSEIVKQYVKIIKQYQIPMSCIPLELTESAMMEESVVYENAKALTAAGFSLHMDDFGSGYSSLTSLSRIPFNTVKLDKSLIDCMNQEKGKAIVQQAICLATLLEMHVVAEGVEKKEQVDMLREMGCSEIQGFYYAAPMSEEALKIHYLSEKKIS